ncbi:hypothetical protein [Psychromonas ossibalaenae]|uniref:hypothetical protein n=1 Tax=Psychromonas ossibalaenae TaxID=444922 RepID=UPI00038128D6|nr:hypothetical protein [Psychromonas ossibalaenae]
MKKLLSAALSLTLMLSHSYVNAREIIKFGPLTLGKNKSEAFIENYTTKENDGIKYTYPDSYGYVIEGYTVNLGQYFDFIERIGPSKFGVETDGKGIIKTIMINFDLNDEEIQKSKNIYEFDKSLCKAVGKSLIGFTINNHKYLKQIVMRIEPAAGRRCSR